MAIKLTDCEHEKLRTKAQAVIVASVDAAGVLLRTNVYKTFWLAHLYAMTLNGRSLTDWPIVKMPQGPGIDEGEAMRRDLIARGLLAEEQVAVGPRLGWQLRIANKRHARKFVRDVLREDDIDAIREAAKSVGEMSATGASDFSHALSRSWRTGKMGEALDIYLDLLIDDEEVDQIREATTRDADLAKKILGG